MSTKGRHNYSFRNVDMMYTERLSPTPNSIEKAGCVLDESWEIVTKNTESRLVKYFSNDLCRFIGDAFGVYLRVRRVEDVQEAMMYPMHKIFCSMQMI